MLAQYAYVLVTFCVGLLMGFRFKQQKHQDCHIKYDESVTNLCAISEECVFWLVETGFTKQVKQFVQTIEN